MDNLPDELLNAPVVFGLARQGHIPIIEKMLAEGCSWDAIGEIIGWCPRTAREHYERYAQLKALNDDVPKNLVAQIEPFTTLAAAVGLLEKLAKNVHDTPTLNDIYGVILQANKHLLSAPRKEK